jgi:hypothetical protein
MSTAPFLPTPFLPTAPFPPATLILPAVWAVAQQQQEQTLPPASSPPTIAFYRKCTEGLLRRYVRMSMEAGKAPSLLGREIFRGKVSSCRVEGFDDAVIFRLDVERCLQKLNPGEHDLVTRIAIQEYTLGEAAKLLGLPPRTVVRRYAHAIDALTRIFLAVEMLQWEIGVNRAEGSNFDHVTQ